MKKLFPFIIFSFLIGCQSNTNSKNEELEDFFKPMVQEELTYISKNMEGIRNDKGKDWYTGDSIFYSTWKKGAQEELEGNHKKAIDYYNKALKVKRYEISSYEVKLSLGRAYMQLDENEKARQMLTEFKKEAQKELSGEEIEWGLTEEAKESLTRDIEDCDYLLSLIEQEKTATP